MNQSLLNEWLKVLNMADILFRDYHFKFIGHKITIELIMTARNDSDFYKRVHDMYGIMFNEIDIIQIVPVIKRE